MLGSGRLFVALFFSPGHQIYANNFERGIDHGSFLFFSRGYTGTVLPSPQMSPLCSTGAHKNNRGHSWIPSIVEVS
jgi:hypothetical protein